MHEPLDRWMDGEFVRAELGRAIEHRLGVAIAGVSITHAHYKIYPKRPIASRAGLDVCYRFDVAAAVPRQVIAYAHFARGKASLQSHANGNPIVLPAHDAALWLFPDDPILAHLPRVTRGMSADSAVSVLNYRPTLRCTARYRGIDRNGTGRDIIGKTYRDAQADAIAARLRALSQSADPSTLAVPRPLGCDPCLHTVWMRRVAGPTLAARIDAAARPEATASTSPCSTLAAQSPACATRTASSSGAAPRLHVERAAASLAALHATRLDDLPAIRVAALLAEADKKAAKLAHCYPALAKLICGVVASLRDQAERLPPPAHSVIHGDCHAGQWVAAYTRTTLVDLDELAWGDPAQDIAQFIVDSGSRAWPHDVGAVFRAAYRRYARRPLDPRWIAWHCTLARLNKVHRQVVQRRWRDEDEVAAGIAAIDHAAAFAEVA